MDISRILILGAPKSDESDTSLRLLAISLYFKFELTHVLYNFWWRIQLKELESLSVRDYMSAGIF